MALATFPWQCSKGEGKNKEKLKGRVRSTAKLNLPMRNNCYKTTVNGEATDKNTPLDSAGTRTKTGNARANEGKPRLDGVSSFSRIERGN